MQLVTDYWKRKYLNFRNTWFHSLALFYYPTLFSFMTHYWFGNKGNITDATRGAGTVYPSEAPEFTPDFYWGSCCSIFSFLCIVL